MAESNDAVVAAATDDAAVPSVADASDAAAAAADDDDAEASDGSFRLYLAEDKRNLDCRFYSARYPEIESLVMVNVRTIADMGAYVSLLEYNNIEGLILLSELSRRRIRSINKLIRVGRNEVAMVLRVDKDKGYIDLSKRRVSPEDVAACEDRFNKAKAVHGVLRHLAERRKLLLEELYERIAWPLYKKYGHAYDAFKIALAEEASSSSSSASSSSSSASEGGGEEDPFASLGVPSDIIEELKLYIRRRLAPQPIKIRADVEVSCFTYEGIDAIRDALFAGIAVGGGDGKGGGESSATSSIKIRLIAPPIYVLSTMTLEKEAGIALLQRAIDVILQRIGEKGGKMDVKMAPKAVSLKEETELQAMMERLEMENQEVAGDEPEVSSFILLLRGIDRSKIELPGREGGCMVVFSRLHRRFCCILPLLCLLFCLWVCATYFVFSTLAKEVLLTS